MYCYYRHVGSLSENIPLIYLGRHIKEGLLFMTVLSQVNVPLSSVEGGRVVLLLVCTLTAGRARKLSTSRRPEGVRTLNMAVRPDYCFDRIE